MGRITPTQIQRLGNELIERHPKKFSKEFDNNKKKVSMLAVIQTKKMRNRLAGYITRKIKTKKEIKLD